MLRKTVDPFTCLKETIQILARPGALLVTMGKREVPNVMAIGWGSVGIVWGKPVFVVLVRPSRYSFTLLKERGQFTVNLPSPELSEVVAYCGSVSGREHDKFRETRLTPEAAETVAVPVIEECRLTYECQVIATVDLLPEGLAPEVKSACYARGDFHRVYYGEILRVTADPDFLSGMAR